MKKWFLKISCLLLILTMITACSAEPAAETNTTENATEEPTGGVVIQNGGTVIYGDGGGIYISGGKLDELMNLVEEAFIGEADRQLMEDAACSAAIASLEDRWSYYIPAADLQVHEETISNAYVGIGITIVAREDGKGFDITQVEESGPAYEAGIRAGDILHAANDTVYKGVDEEDPASVIKGEEGTTVDVTVIRAGQTIVFTVERRVIETTVVEHWMLPGNIGLVTIYNFGETCAAKSIASIQQLLEEGATSLIFDVRFNPGGYAAEMVTLLDYLLPEGEVFISEDYTGYREVDYSDASCLDIPMVVLVNEDTYSAAEFFASALMDYEWATIVGGQTSGKGYFQQVLMLSDGSAVNLSVGKYYTRNGVNLAEQGGLTPDVEVAVDDETYAKIYYGMLTHEEDPQLQEAINILSGAQNE